MRTSLRSAVFSQGHPALAQPLLPTVKGAIALLRKAFGPLDCGSPRAVLAARCGHLDNGARPDKRAGREPVGG